MTVITLVCITPMYMYHTHVCVSPVYICVISIYVLYHTTICVMPVYAIIRVYLFVYQCWSRTVCTCNLVCKVRGAAKQPVRGSQRRGDGGRQARPLCAPRLQQSRCIRAWGDSLNMPKVTGTCCSCMSNVSHSATGAVLSSASKRIVVVLSYLGCYACNQPINVQAVADAVISFTLLHECFPLNFPKGWQVNFAANKYLILPVGVSVNRWWAILFANGVIGL